MESLDGLSTSSDDRCIANEDAKFEERETHHDSEDETERVTGRYSAFTGT